jgi:hypothetical protein
VGRRSFTRKEVDELRQLFREKQTADASRQKVLRARMRRIGFYISDFSSDAQGFVVSDLDELVRRGTLTVVDDPAPASEAAPGTARSAAADRDQAPERDADGVAASLTAEPVAIQAALLPAEAGGAPSSPGFYAWWATRGAIADAPHHPHPLDAGLGLLYVGISPARASSRADIRSRVLGQHVRGNTSSSTFRFVLAALLLDELALTPRRAARKVVLDPKDNERLRTWQLRHLRLTWRERDHPWEVEAEVIARMQPPLNSAGNRDHPFYARVSSARAAFRAAARL